MFPNPPQAETSNSRMLCYMTMVLAMERDELTMLVARNIEALMRQQHTDAAKLARQSGVNPTGVYDILSGKSRSPKIETIQKIARGLNVPVSAIFETRDVQDERQMLLQLFDALPDSQRRLLVQTAKAWLPAKAAS